MSILGTQLSLAIGRSVPTPAPKFIAAALQTLTVTHSDRGPSAFQIGFHADRSPKFSQDYSLLGSPLLKPGNRVALTVTFKGSPHLLMDGFITHQELSHSDGVNAATLTVTGEDVSILMDLKQISKEFPGMSDPAIVQLILATYIPKIGLIPAVTTPSTSSTPSPQERVPQQNATDRNYLWQLAKLYGYVFYVYPGPTPLSNTAYWGPPKRPQPPQKALTVDMGPASNVLSINFTYDALAPTLVEGEVQDTETEKDISVFTTNSQRPQMSSSPALANRSFVRRQQFTDPRYDAALAREAAQSITDTSTDDVAIAQGELDALRYGSVLKARGRVGLRGVGQSYDGDYYVKSVTHTISRGSYKQSFTLTREGVGSLISEVVP